MEWAEEMVLPSGAIFPKFPSQPADDSPKAIDVNKVMRDSTIAGTPAETGIDLGRPLGAFNIHPGYGSGGEGSFPWFVDNLRHKGLDIVIVIACTKPMDFARADVKPRMTR